jgi:hypothetical protein
MIHQGYSTEAHAKPISLDPVEVAEQERLLGPLACLLEASASEVAGWSYDVWVVFASWVTKGVGALINLKRQTVSTDNPALHDFLASSTSSSAKWFPIMLKPAFMMLCNSSRRSLLGQHSPDALANTAAIAFLEHRGHEAGAKLAPQIL